MDNLQWSVWYRCTNVWPDILEHQLVRPVILSKSVAVVTFCNDLATSYFGRVSYDNLCESCLPSIRFQLISFQFCLQRPKVFPCSSLFYNIFEVTLDDDLKTPMKNTSLRATRLRNNPLYTFFSATFEFHVVYLSEIQFLLAIHCALNINIPTNVYVIYFIPN